MNFSTKRCIKPFGESGKKCSKTLIKIKPLTLLRLKTLNIVADDNTRICSSCEIKIRTSKIEPRCSEKVIDTDTDLLASPKQPTSAGRSNTPSKSSTSAASSNASPKPSTSGCIHFSPKPLSSDSPTSSSSQTSNVESSSDFSDPTTKKTLVTELNRSIILPILEVSPISAKKLAHNKNYATVKCNDISNKLKRKLKPENEISSGDSDEDKLNSKCFQEMINQLKEKFKMIDNKNEKLKLLTVLPESWNALRIKYEFNCSYRMAKNAKDLQRSKGIIL